MVTQIIISPTASQDIFREIEKVSTRETGGVLCGRYSQNELIIESASGPGPNAMHRLDEFIMDKQYMHAYLDDEYVKSEGMNIYIGEWHTHPQVTPLPSQTDLTSIRERSEEWSSGDIIFIIIGFVGLTTNNLNDQIVAIYYDRIKGDFWEVPVVIT